MEPEVTRRSGRATAVERRLRTFVDRSRFVQSVRKRRYGRFVSLVALRPDDRILDVGAGWGAALERFNETNPVTAVDLASVSSAWLSRPNVSVRVADGRDLPFSDGEFDVVFCNSVIEHMPPGDQEKLAAEISRVAHRYYVQTPYRFFPVEPHRFTFLLHFLSNPWRRRLHRYVKLGNSRGRWERIYLLTVADLRRLFPDAEVHRERFLGLTKSLMAVRR